MIPEAAYAMLACARIGAISIVFGGFSSQSDRRSRRGTTKQRHHHRRRGIPPRLQVVPLKKNADKAIALPPSGRCVKNVLVVSRTGGKSLGCGRDVWWHEAARP